MVAGGGRGDAGDLALDPLSQLGDRPRVGRSALDDESRDLALSAHHPLKGRQWHDHGPALEQAVALVDPDDLERFAGHVQIVAYALAEVQREHTPQQGDAALVRAERATLEDPRAPEEQAVTFPAVDEGAGDVGLLEADGVHE